MHCQMILQIQWPMKTQAHHKSHCVYYPFTGKYKTETKTTAYFQTLCCFSFGKLLEQSNLNANMSDRLKCKTNSLLSLPVNRRTPAQ